MLRLLITFVAASYASAALHSICHSNHQQMTELQVINLLADACDRNRDGILKEGEIVVGFAEILETSLPLTEQMILGMDYDGLVAMADLFGFSIDKNDFVQKWHAKFHDNHEFIAATFDAFDDNHDGSWSILEVDNIMKHILATSDDGDGVISRVEFVDYFTAIYQNC